ncbi:hypothetical protein ES702_01264 [subsurface metagenome]
MKTQIKKRRRARLEVIKDILDTIQNKGYIGSTKLLYSSNLSPQMFKGYLNELLEKEFIKLEIDKRLHKRFSLTDKGLDFLEKYQILESFIEKAGLK